MPRWSLGLVSVVLLAGGCDDTLFGIAQGDGPVVPNYTDDWQGVQEMFDDHCVACHPAVNALVLADIEADVVSGDEVFIVAGDAQASYFYRKISATLDDGDPGTPMPPAAGLQPADYAHVEAWINAGAPLPEGN